MTKHSQLDPVCDWQDNEVFCQNPMVKFLSLWISELLITATMSLIWYNPEVKKYQSGDLRSYKRSRSNSNSPERFTLLSRLPEVSDSLIDKIIRRLNMAELA